MKALRNLKEKIKNWYRGLPDKKKYIELVTAILSVPVLITVILLNLGNLSKNKDTEKFSPTPAKKEEAVTPIQIEIKTNESTPSSGLPVTSTDCKKEVGPIEIVSPEEGQRITSDPVCLDLSYKKGEYCAYVWSYRINGGSWSDYTDKNICLYNLSSGDKKLEVRVKSIASGDEVILKRNFIYENPNPSPTTATISAALEN